MVALAAVCWDGRAGVWAIISDRALPWRAAQLAALLLVGAGLWEALTGRDADLLEGRRRFRLVLAVGVGLCIVGLTLLAYAASQGIHAYGGLIGPGSVLALALASALLRLRIEPVSYTHLTLPTIYSV